MTEITQKLGFDAADAIRQLSNLHRSLETVNSSLGRMNTLMGQTSTSQFASQTQAITNNLNQVSQGFHNAQRSAQTASRSMTLSWTTVARVIQAQVIVRALRQVINGFIDASDAAREFQLTIARTQAIAGGSASEASFQNISEQVRSLAVEIGRPIQEVASAAFQTLQNDISESTNESLRFLQVASNLAVVLGADTTQAMNSLSSIMKSFGEDTSTAAKNADTLFVAVDKGRITLDKLVDRLGTINPLAAELGFTFQTTAAAAAALTQLGLNEATATTQLRNVFTKLLRPTEALRELIIRAGAETGSGQELVDIFGGDLVAVLRALRDAANGSEVALANAFGTIRGQLGVLNLFANDSKVLVDILGAMEDQAGAVNDALQLVEATTARRFERELAKLEDTMLGLGNITLQAKTEFLSLFNQAVPDATSAISVLATGVGVLSGAMLAYSLSTSTATVNMATFGAGAARLTTALLSRSGVLGALVAITGYMAGEFFKVMNEAETQIDSVTRETARVSKIAADEQQRATQQAIQANDAYVKSLKTSIGTLGGLFSQFYSDQATELTEVLSRTGISLERLGTGFAEKQKALLSEVDRFIESIDNRVKSAADNAQAIGKSLEDFTFERGLKSLDESAQAANRLKRAVDALNASRNISIGLDQKSQDSAREQLQVAERLAKEALSAADASKDAQAIAAAEALVVNALKARQELEAQIAGQLGDINKERINASRDELARLQAEQTRLVELVKSLNSQVDETGRQRTPQQILDLGSQRAEAEALLQDINRRIQELDIVQALGLDELASKSGDAFVRGIAAAEFDYTNAIRAFQLQLQDTKFQVFVDIVDSSRTDATGRLREALDVSGAGGPLSGISQQIDSLRQLENASIAANNRLEELNKNRDTFLQGLGTVAKTALIRESDLLGPLDKLGVAFRSGFGLLDITKQLEVARQQNRLQSEQGVNATAALVVALTDAQNEFNQLGNVSEDVLNRIAASANRLSSEVADDEVTQNIANQARNFAQAIRSIQEEISQLNVQILSDEELSKLDVYKERFNALGQAARDLEAVRGAEGQIIDAQQSLELIESLYRQSIPAGAERTSSAVNDIKASTDAAAASAAEATRNFQAMAQAAAAALSASGGPLQGRFNGGLLYRAQGGPTRGQDKVMAALDPNEYVINSRATRQFFTQLQAMNSGRNPIYRDQGGNVTNVGDINVYVSGQQGTDGRSLAQSIKREIRRNNL